MNQDELGKLQKFAASVASAASLIALSDYDNPEVNWKEDGSEVTSADLRIQQMAYERICLEFPEHALLGEEDNNGSRLPAPKDARYCWVIDPIDGTRNYVRKLPDFCTSIALLMDGRPQVGLIRHHPSGRSYSAIHGHGAYLGNNKLQIAQHTMSKRPVVFFQPDEEGTLYRRARNWLPRTHARNLGSTALHMAMLAAGNVDGIACVKSKLWDIAAGTLIVEEAGGTVTGLDGNRIFPYDLSRDPEITTSFIAGSAETHSLMLDGLQPDANTTGQLFPQLLYAAFHYRR